MEALAEGDLDVEVKGADARATSSAPWRAPSRCSARTRIRVREHDRGRAGQRPSSAASSAPQMMQQLQRAFGEVVDAAVAGDFSQRVEANFPDAELNSLAAQRQQSGRDRRSRPRRDRRGAGGAGPDRPHAAHATATIRAPSAQLSDDTNAVAEKLTEIVGQLARHLARAEDGDRRNPVGRQRSQRAHHQAGGDHRGDLGRDGAAGRDRGRQCQARRAKPAPRPRPVSQHRRPRAAR